MGIRGALMLLLLTTAMAHADTQPGKCSSASGASHPNPDCKAAPSDFDTVEMIQMKMKVNEAPADSPESKESPTTDEEDHNVALSSNETDVDLHQVSNSTDDEDHNVPDELDLQQIHPAPLPCIMTANAAISGHNYHSLSNQTVGSCSVACREAAFCKTFDFHKGTGICDLSDKAASDVGGLKTDYPGNPYDHYDCTSGPASVTPTKIQLGAAIHAACGVHLQAAAAKAPCMGLTVEGPVATVPADKALMAPGYPGEFSGYSPFRPVDCGHFVCDVVKMQAFGNCVMSSPGWKDLCDPDLGICAPCDGVLH